MGCGKCFIHNLNRVVQNIFTVIVGDYFMDSQSRFDWLNEDEEESEEEKDESVTDYQIYHDESFTKRRLGNINGSDASASMVSEKDLHIKKLRTLINIKHDA